MPATPRLTSEDLAALRALADGAVPIGDVNRYWLSVYQLIDETPAGWRVTPRGRDYLGRLKTQTRGDVVAVADARSLTLNSARRGQHL